MDSSQVSHQTPQRCRKKTLYVGGQGGEGFPNRRLFSNNSSPSRGGFSRAQPNGPYGSGGMATSESYMMPGLQTKHKRKLKSS